MVKKIDKHGSIRSKANYIQRLMEKLTNALRDFISINCSAHLSAKLFCSCVFQKKNQRNSENIPRLNTNQ